MPLLFFRQGQRVGQLVLALRPDPPRGLGGEAGMRLRRRFLCPDCLGKLEFLGENGSFAIGEMICSVDILMCENSHVWLRAHQPEMVDA